MKGEKTNKIEGEENEVEVQEEEEGVRVCECGRVEEEKQEDKNGGKS